MNCYPHKRKETWDVAHALLYSNRNIQNEIQCLPKQQIFQRGTVTHSDPPGLEPTEDVPALFIEASPINARKKLPHAAPVNGFEARSHLDIPYRNRFQAISLNAPAPDTLRQGRIGVQDSSIGDSSIGDSRVETKAPPPVEKRNPFQKGNIVEYPLLIQNHSAPALLLSPIEKRARLDEQITPCNTTDGTAILKNCRHWKKEEDDILRLAIHNETGPRYPWTKIAREHFSNSRSALQCRNRWTKNLSPGILKGSWNEAEDQLIVKLREAGLGWIIIAAHLPWRRPEQIRDRYVNKLDRNLKFGPWTADEDKILFREQRKIGNRWTKIARLLQGRSENSVKNRWHSFNRSIRQKAKKHDTVHTARLDENGLPQKGCSEKSCDEGKRSSWSL